MRVLSNAIAEIGQHSIEHLVNVASGRVLWYQDMKGTVIPLKRPADWMGCEVQDEMAIRDVLRYASIAEERLKRVRLLLFTVHVEKIAYSGPSRSAIPLEADH